MFFVSKEPPRIHHLPCRPDGYKEMTAAAVQNIRLSKRAGKLQALYADSAEGFRPALRFVENQTGISRNKVSEIRKELVDHGLIAYDQEMIMIDWDRIRTYAALANPLPKRGRLTYAPVKPDEKDWSRVPICKTAEYQRLQWREQPRHLEKWEEAFFAALESMTPAEYTEIVCGMGGGIPDQGHTLETDDWKEISEADYAGMVDWEAACFDEE